MLQAQNGPGGVPGSVLWLRADGITGLSSGTGIQTWNDQSGLGNNFTQITPSFRPQYSTLASDMINFNPVALHTGSQSTSDANGIMSAGTKTNIVAFLVGKNTVLTNNTTLNGQSINWHAPYGDGTIYWDANSRIFTSSGIVAGSADIITGYNVSPTLREIRRNGNTLYSDGTPTNFSVTAGIMTLGANYNGGIGEVIFYDTYITPAQRNRIESYLAIKYGITQGTASAPVDYLNSAGNTIWATTPNTYQNNIAGIAYDVASALMQKQSVSSNSGLQPVIGLPNIAATNATNSSTFASDLSSLVWGSNTSSTNFNTAFPFSNLSVRMARIWRVQETGTVGTVKVALRVADVLGSVTRLTLLVNGNDTFDGTASQITMAQETIGGVPYYTATVDFSSGQFFTFAGYITAPGGVTGNLLRWHKADAGVVLASGANINRWTDSYGGTLAEQSATANQPAYNTTSNLANFNPSINFSNNQNLTNNVAGLPQGGSPSTFFYVDRPSAANTSMTAFGYGTSTGNTGFNAGTGSPFSTKQGGGGNFAQQANAYVQNVLSLTRTGYNISPTNAYLSHNGRPEVSSTNYAQNITSNNFTIGSLPGNTGFYSGDIPEVIAYSTKLGAADAAKVESYLAIKYGITLGTLGSPVNYVNSAGNTIWATGSNTYQNNIAGIAVDEASGLKQKQSVSANSGLQPVIGLANIAATNAANPNEFASDLSSLVWGSDAGSTDFSVPFAFSSLSNRMARIWRIQETGTVGSVKVALRVADISGSITGVTLLVNGNATFDGTASQITMAQESIGGVLYYTTTIDFSPGQFFTFAGYTTAPGGVTGNLLRWYKADAGVTLASGVSTWGDSYGGANVTQLTTTNQPAYNSTGNLMNFNPNIRFDGINDNLLNNVAGLPQGGSPFTFFYVDRPSTITASQFAFGYGAASGPDSFHAGPSSTFTTKQAGGSNFALQIKAYERSLPSLTRTGFDGRAYLSHNGLTEVLSTSYPQNITSNNFAIGSRSDGLANYFAGDIPEVIAYSTKLSSTDATKVESYLAIKYGINKSGDYLSSSGAVIWSQVSGYDTNIAGIGRDNASGLHQRVSRSVAAGGNLTLSTSSDFTSANSDLSRTDVSGNLSFLIIGNNNSSFIERIPSDVASGFNTRLTREWRVQNTNYTQNVNLEFSGLSFIAGLSWTLVWDADGDFTSGATNLGVINSSRQITLSGTQLQTGYFALMSFGADNDNDGVIDLDDQDDDNDGILDLSECPLAETITDVSGTGGTYILSSANAGFRLDILSMDDAFQLNINGVNIATSNMETITNCNTATLRFADGTLFGTPEAQATYGFFGSNDLPRIRVIVDAGGTVRLFGTKLPSDAVLYPLELFNGNSLNMVPINLTGTNTVVITQPICGPTGISGRLVTLQDNFCDADGDLVRNVFDLDSDGDGCQDFVEGTSFFTPANDTNNDGRLDGSVGTNGVPLIAGAGQGIGVSQKALVNGCQAPGGVVTNLGWWYKGDFRFATGATTTWDDASATDLQLSQANSTRQPLNNRLQNFNSVVSFDGSDAMNNAVGYWKATTGNTAYNVFAVTRHTASTGSGNALFSENTSIGIQSLLNDNSGAIFNVTSWPSFYSTVTFSPTMSNVPQLITARYNTVGNIRTLASNGQNLGVTQAGTYPSFNGSSGNLVIGNHRDESTWPFQGDIAEIFIYGADKTTAEINSIQSYLAIKWGVSLDQTTAQNYVSSSGNIIWDATANSAYKNNIAGIGRDDATALNQKQSQSVNTSLQPVIANVNMAATNTANTNNFSVDQSFLIWGSDNASAQFATPISYGGLNTRMGRIWKVQETGAVGNVKVAIPSSTIGFSNVTLLVSNDNIFDGSDTRLTMTLESIGGIQYYTAITDFTNGQFFTFGGFIIAPGGVTGSLLWLRPDMGVSNTVHGGSINQWNDQSGSGNNVTQNTVANQPTYGNNATNNINFNPVINFNGVNHNMSDPSGLFGTNTYSNAAVFTTAVTNAVQFNTLFFENLGVGSEFSIHTPWGDGQAYWDGAASGNRITVPWGGTVGVPYLWTGWNNSSLATKVSFRRNGLQIASSSSFTNFTGNNSPMFIGSFSNSTNHHSGRVGDIIIYATPLTAIERARVESYLAIKYGIMLNQTIGQDYLASDGTVIWSSAANSSYNNNIAGIGRDDFSALTQKQSASVNSGDQIIVSLGTVQASNVTNTGSFTADKQFLVWGDNAGSLTSRPDISLPKPNNANFAKRLGRIWKVQNTNSFDQSITIYFPTATLTTAFGSLQPYLVCDNQADFKGAVRQSVQNNGTLTINGTSYTSFTISVPASQPNIYLTFSTNYFQALVNPAGTISIQNGRVNN